MNIFRNIYDWFVALLSSAPRKNRTEEDRALETFGISDQISESIDPHPSGTSTFNPNSERAKKGLAFQNEVFTSLKKAFPGNDTFEETWGYFLKDNPNLSEYELACLEKEWGDITFVHEGQRFWVECCLAMGKENSWFCEMKRIKFRGLNKFYCWGKIDEPGKMWFIPSKQWNEYVGKCDRVKQGKKSFRVVPKHLIGDNIRVAKRGTHEFAKYIA